MKEKIAIQKIPGILYLGFLGENPKNSRIWDPTKIPSQSHHWVQELPEYELVLQHNQPLSPGEVLGCTAPDVGKCDALIYLGEFFWVDHQFG